MFNIMDEFVSNEECRVTGYCIVPIAEADKTKLSADYGSLYDGSKYYLVAIATVDNGGEGLEEDMVDTISTWVCDENYLSFTDTPFVEEEGDPIAFAEQIILIGKEGILV